MHNSIALAKHEKGSKVLYKSRGSLLEEALIQAVHFDDVLEPYYTIRIVKDGREKQTDDAHIIPFSNEYEGSGSSNSVRVNGGSHSYHRRCYDDSCFQVDGYFSNNQPFGLDHLDNHRIYRAEAVKTSHVSDTTRSKLTTRQQALPTSILRPSSYVPIPPTDSTDNSASRGDDNRYFNKESTDSNIFVEVSKRKYGIFDALRSYVSSFQSKTNKTRRMRGSGIVADDPHSTNNLHERDDSITSISSGAVGCSERALSDATIAQKSKIISAPIDQSEKARSQSAISVPLSRLAYNDQEGISDEIQDEKMRNAELLSKKRRIDHESERCEQPPFKKTRYISEDISYVDSQNDNENLSSPIGNRTYRCLYRPRIDKRYFERKHKKKVRVNVLSPVKRQQFCLQDQAINTSSCIHKTGGLFGSDCYDTLATSTFDNHSDFYAEISAKARHLRLKRRSQIPDKKRVELRESV